MTVIGNGRRLRSAYDRDHDKILVRRGRCRVCGRTVTVLPARCVPAASYSLIARQESLRRIGDGFFIGPSRHRNALAEVGERLFRDLDVEGTDGSVFGR